MCACDFLELSSRRLFYRSVPEFICRWLSMVLVACADSSYQGDATLTPREGEMGEKSFLSRHPTVRTRYSQICNIRIPHGPSGFFLRYEMTWLVQC